MIGAFAVGALVIGRLTIWRLKIDGAVIDSVGNSETSSSSRNLNWSPTKGNVMWTYVIERIDGPLERREVPRPEPAAGQVLVRIAARGVNPLDIKIRSGRAAHAAHLTPAVPGLDMAVWRKTVGLGSHAVSAGR